MVLKRNINFAVIGFLVLFISILSYSVDIDQHEKDNMENQSLQESLSRAADSNPTKLETGIGVDNVAMEITALDVHNITDFVLSEHLGKLLIIEFMAPWCSTCRRQELVLRRFVDVADLEVITINVDPSFNPSQLASFAKDSGITWFVGSSSEVSVDYFVRAVPTVLFVDREGVIRFRGYFTKYESLESLIEKFK